MSSLPNTRCCTVNTLQPNPQTTDYDTSVITNNAAAQTMVSNVTSFVDEMNTIPKKVNKNFGPIFKTYHDYMNYLQGKR